jgi:hypothetical protein
MTIVTNRIDAPEPKQVGVGHQLRKYRTAAEVLSKWRAGLVEKENWRDVLPLQWLALRRPWMASRHALTDRR